MTKIKMLLAKAWAIFRQKKVNSAVLSAFIILGIYDFIAVFFFDKKMPSLSHLTNELVFQFDLWQAVVFIVIGHLLFNRNNVSKQRLRWAFNMALGMNGILGDYSKVYESMCEELRLEE